MLSSTDLPAMTGIACCAMLSRNDSERQCIYTFRLSSLSLVPEDGVHLVLWDLDLGFSHGWDGRETA